MCRAILLWLLPLALWGQDSRCTVEGMVLNGGTGDALRRATVTLRRLDVPRSPTAETRYTATTDTQGKYVINEIDPGTYLLTAERTGFAPARYNTSVKLEHGQKSSGLLIMMTPHAVIAGRVLDDEGEPVTGADVQVSALSYATGRKQLTRAGGASTNDLGEYRVFGLAPGKYYLSVSYRPGQQLPSGDEYAVTYYPRTADAGAAVPIGLAAGAQLRNIDVILARTRTVAVRGRVQSEVQGEKKMFMLSIMPRLAAGITSMSISSRAGGVRPDGSFEIQRVPPGTFNVIVSATIDDKRYSSRAQIQVGSTDVEGVHLTIRQTGMVSGRVHVEGRDEEQLLGVTVGLRPWESGGVIFGASMQSKVPPDGKFVIDGVNIDRYGFYATGLPEGYYLKSVRTSGVDVLANGYEASGGAANFDVLLSPNAGTIEGTTTPGATVALVPDNRDRTEYFANVTADQEGHFRFRNVVPGEYKVFAWEQVPEFAWMDPDYMRELERKGTVVSVAESAHPTIQVKALQ